MREQNPPKSPVSAPPLPAAAGPVTDFGRDRQGQIYLSGVTGRRPTIAPQAAALEAQAEAVMSRRAFAYVAGGAGAERSVRANIQAFERWRIVPRVLRDVSTRDTSVELLGERLPFPVLLAPVGALDLVHPLADLAVARAAAAAAVPLILSSQAGVAMETCARAMGDGQRWFQLYWAKSDALMLSFVRRAEAAGCQAIVVTLDTAFLGWRPRDLALGYLPFSHGLGIAQYTSDPVFQASLAAAQDPLPPAGRVPVTLSALLTVLEQARRHPGSFLGNLRSGVGTRAVRQFLAVFSRPSLSWDDLGRLRQATRLPILLKGVLHPEDARRAIAAGMDGVIVSNHGGRQLDGEIAALDALPTVAAAVEGRIAVLFDSGIRGGADVFKAIALGAQAVCVGRPYVYALALAGEAGVRQMLADLRAEFDLTLALAGCGSVGEIGPGALQAAASRQPAADS